MHSSIYGIGYMLLKVHCGAEQPANLTRCPPWPCCTVWQGCGRCRSLKTCCSVSPNLWHATVT